MKQKKAVKFSRTNFPVVIELDEDGFYVAECPLFKGCYSQGKTIKKALTDLKQVIIMCLEEKNNREIAKSYHPVDVSLRSITL